jgi:hypothetical protein
MAWTETWFAPFMWDPDYLFDLVPIPGHVHFVFDNATHPRCNAQGVGLLHCEIDSAIKTTACVGGMIGSAIGAALGIAVLAPLLLAAVACGPFVLLCLVLAFLIAAVAAAVGAWLGGVIGQGVGILIDHLSGAGDEFESLEDKTCIATTGRWVIDHDHGHNEVHPVEFFSPPAKDEQGNPLHANCPDLCTPPPIERPA